MKKMIILVPIVILFIFIFKACVNLFPSLFGFILFKTSELKIVNENGDKIEATIFKKNRTLDNIPTEELIVYFPSNVSYKYLTIVVDHEIIGVADKTNSNIWVPLNKNVAYLSPRGSHFIVLNNSIEDVITQFNFSNKIIQFNTFNEFQKFWKNINIKKL